MGRLLKKPHLEYTGFLEGVQSVGSVGQNAGRRTGSVKQATSRMGWVVSGLFVR